MISNPPGSGSRRPSLGIPILFFLFAITQLHLFNWATNWVLSGAPILTLALLIGDSNNYRILSAIHTWTLFTTINLAYCVAATSWLLYWVFVTLCYPVILITCIFQFSPVARLARGTLRALIKRAHFVDDKIALFDIPALEIDKDVAGLVVFRGITISLSSLTITVHGAEVGIKLSDQLEVSLQTEWVQVSLFRKAEMGDTYINFKGGPGEMTFKDTAMPDGSRAEELRTVFDSDSPILRAATGEMGRNSSVSIDRHDPKLKFAHSMESLKDEVTDGRPPTGVSAKTAVRQLHAHSFQNDPAGSEYRRRIKYIKDTSAINQSRTAVHRIEDMLPEPTDPERNKGENDERAGDSLDGRLRQHAIRAAICSNLHPKPSTPNPPAYSLKVTTIRKLSSPRVKRLLHRMPLLLRLLLNPIAYLHPVTISSITATASGRWIEEVLVGKIFKDYGESDPDLKNFKHRVSEWVSGANFAVQLGELKGFAQVPVDTSHDIKCQMDIQDILAYRASPKEVSLTRIVQLKGADAMFTIPSYMLPHHEHIVPLQLPSDDGSPKNQGDAAQEGDSSGRGHIKVPLRLHAHLPAIFHQELLDFIALLIKSSKLVELEQQANSSPSSGGEEDEAKSSVRQGLSGLTDAFNKRMKISMKKALVANDKWLARQVGKIMTKLEHVRGEVGYSGDIPVPLSKYRDTGWLDTEGEKLLS